ncbi:MAG: DUF1819 family protein [Coriobacteriales bacterium]|jgi:hypothetical protein
MSKDYCMSMSGSSARIPESVIAAQTYLELRDWNATRKSIVDDNLFQLNAVSSRKRVSGEIVKRLRTLTDDEVAFFSSAYGDDRCAMLWVAICRTYPFVRDLSEQLLAGRYNRTIPDLTREAYDVFFEEQSEIHPELTALTEKSRDKVRNVVFRMLDECKLVNKQGKITPLHPTSSFKSSLDEEHRDDLLLFPGKVA